MSQLHKRVSLFLLILFLTGAFQSTVWAKAYKKADTQPPTAPQNLVAASLGSTSVTLQWTASTDNKAVASYQIYQNSVLVASTSTASYSVSNLNTATTYSFYVKAKDTSANLSRSSSVLTITTLPTQSASRVVSAYYAGWSAYSGYTPLKIPAAQLTAIHYAFAIIGDDLKIAMGDPYIDPANFAQLNQLKKQYPNVKTLISIGGWSDSGKFSDVALSDASRTTFADSVVAFLKQYGFNGVDIDWEYPVSGGLSNTGRLEDRVNFTLLLQKLREKLDTQGQLDGQTYLLTIAGGADRSYASNTQLNLVASYVDYASIMTYDIHGQWDSYTDFNAPLYTPSESSPQYQWSVDEAVSLWIASGFPASKIVMGIPFYGHLYSGVSDGSTGLYQRFTAGAAISYDDLCASYLGNSTYVKSVHPDALVPWLFNGTTFLSYDDETSIAAKSAYIVQNKLAGACVWELSQNQGGQLLNALLANLR